MTDPLSQVEETGGFVGPRPARPDERDQLLALVNLIFRTNLGREPTIGADWPHVYEPQNLANVMVISERTTEVGRAGNEPREKLVASTGVWPSDVMVGDVRLRVGGINCVGTLPEYRRHGFGSHVMEAAQERMRDLGCHVGLLGTGIPNWYRRLGWEEGGIQRAYRLNRGNITLLPLLRPGLSMRIVEIDQTGIDLELASEIVRLHHNERLGAMRTVERLRQLAAARRVERIVLAEAAGIPIAYLLLRENMVMEWAGAAEDVVALTRATFEWLDDATISTTQRGSDGVPLSLRTLMLQTSGWHHPVVNLLNARRIPYSVEYLGMLYLLDPHATLAAYAHADARLADVRLEGDDDDFALRDGNTTLQLDRRMLTKLFFGPERVSDATADLFPLPFWQWSMERV